MRIGSGLDIHRLILDPARPLMLGGVEIPSDLALEGHSDADALLHALTDAILGALGQGDIGEFFPNTDPQWKDAPSTTFLTLALRHMREQGLAIANVDCTILAEAPKLNPHKAAIKARLASLLDVSLNQIGLKATTAEGLGAIGRSEGLLAQAVVLLVENVQPAKVLTVEAAKPKPTAAAPAQQKIPLTAIKEVIAKDLATKPGLAPKSSGGPALPAAKEGTLRIWCDGASRGNPGPASIGVVVQDANGLVVHEGKMVIGTATNNVAEYRALIYGLRIASPMMPEVLEVRMDSELVIKQMKGEYKVKDYKMQQLHAEAKEVSEDFETIKFIHVRREENMLADALANEALDEG